MSKKQRIVLMDCMAIGGCADGVLLKGIRADAKFISLRRPVSVKPLTSVLQKQPDVVFEEDQYEIHPIQLVDSAPGSKPAIYGLAVVVPEQLTWAFNELLKRYIMASADKAPMIDSSKKPH